MYWTLLSSYAKLASEDRLKHSARLEIFPGGYLRLPSEPLLPNHGLSLIVHFEHAAFFYFEDIGWRIIVFKAFVPTYDDRS